MKTRVSRTSVDFGELVGVDGERSQVQQTKKPSALSMVDVGWRFVYFCLSSQCKSQLGFAWSFKGAHLVKDLRYKNQ